MPFVFNPSIVDNANEISLQILAGAYYYAFAREDWTGNPVRPPYSRLYYIVSGDPYCYLDGRRVDLQAGHCYLFPTGLSFRYACDTSMSHLFFHIRLCDGNGDDMLRGLAGVMECPVGDEKIRAMMELFSGKTPLDALRLRQEIYASVLTMLDNGGVELTAVHYSDGVKRAVEYIRTHLSMKLTVGEVADNVFLSASTLAKRFKREVGISIGGFIDDAVLFEADRLLIHSDLSIQQISERFGFCDQFYFARRFKEKYGMTPQRYRRMRWI